MAGVDGQTIGAFEADLGRNLYRIWNRMSLGSYFPATGACRSNSEKEWGPTDIGCATVSDRIAKLVVKQLIEQELDQSFLSDSYGYSNGATTDAVSYEAAHASPQLLLRSKL
ncbi:hypothetical protein AS026_31105 [Rhizobium altiplani]|uniref:Reverse transcriptase domain-containing protein n=1 Tax=Rhizobium altiplani TaxID=1864509 RepID=A0A120FPU4_9HYPH|nr:hypothetical protein AS026_31105 [Rhizobium altiplani]